MSHVQSPEAFIAELWSYAAEVPMEQHPWFHGLLHHRWTPEQIILGELQHYLRVRTNPVAPYLTVVRYPCNANGGPDMVLLVRSPTILGGQAWTPHDMLPQCGMSSRRPKRSRLFTSCNA